MATPRYRLADTAQQAVGGVLLAGPFVVTEEVWVLAARMSPLHTLVTVGIVGAIGYGALYEADDDRDPDREADFWGVPVRFLSLLAVAYGSVLLLALVLSAPRTFLVAGRDPILSSPSTTEVVATTVRVVSVGAVFSVVGAATADSIF